MEAGPAPDSQAQTGRAAAVRRPARNLNAVFYLVRGGIQWRMLPHDFPPWGTVHYYYRQWRRDGTWEAIQNALRTKVRHKAGRHKSPDAAIIDSQTVKRPRWEAPAATTLASESRDVNGTSWSIPWVCCWRSWSTPQAFRTLPGEVVLAKIVGRFPRLRLIWTDGAYQPVVGWAKSFGGWTLELVRKPKELRTFQVLPHRWQVERTLGWLNRSRRLSKDYEHDTGSSEAMVHLAMIHLMLNVFVQFNRYFSHRLLGKAAFGRPVENSVITGLAMGGSPTLKDSEFPMLRPRWPRSGDVQSRGPVPPSGSGLAPGGWPRRSASRIRRSGGGMLSAGRHTGLAQINLTDEK